MNNNPGENKIDPQTKKMLEDFVKSGKADKITKNLGNIDKAKVLKMFSSLSSDDIKKGLAGGMKNIDFKNLNQFMKDKH